MSKSNTSTTPCYHCGLPAEGAAACTGDIAGEQHHFCCSGCLSVCQVIHESGLDAFYQRLQKREATLSPPPDAPADIDQYDLTDIQDDFVQKLDDGSYQTQLMVEGIHCAACVWLIEKALHGMEGIIQAEVNLVHHRLSLRWQPERIRLTQILQRLAALGYAAVPFNPERLEGHVKQQNRQLLFRLGFAGFGAMNMMWISIALYAGAFSGISSEYRHFFHWVSFAIATPVLLYSGTPIFRAAWQGLRQARLGMDLPIALGASITYGYSVWQLLHQGEHVYFDTVVSFLFVILIGRYLEALARRNASSATLRLLELQPRMATLVTQDGDQRISVRQLHTGDCVRIRPGDKIPADGVIMEGESHIDESMLTGESKAIHKRPGQTLIAGTINGESALLMLVEKVGEHTVLSQIIRMVEEAQNSKAHIQSLADRIAPYFVATTLALATLTFLYWFRMDMDTALLAATSVLIITCPCALGLATPMAIAVSTGLAAKHGVLIRNGRSLEKLTDINHIVMDKTGTLTEGNITISDMLFTQEPQHALQLAGSLERYASHPIAQAICTAQEKQSLPFLPVQNAQHFPGQGIQGDIQINQQHQTIWVGNQHFMQQQGIPLTHAQQQACDEIEQHMGIAIFIASAGEIIALLHLEDQIRQDTHSFIHHLAQSKLPLTILTGDSKTAALHLKQQLTRQHNINIQVIAEVLPEHKAREILALQQQGKRVLMVGDGINDAPALAQADVSMAMGTGTDISMECSDIVLMGGELHRIPWAIQLSHRTLRTIRQNLMFSLAYNAILVPTAMAAWVTPIFAALAMPLSSLVVTINAILIRWHMRS